MRQALDNADKTAQLERKATAALMEGIARDWEAAQEAAKDAGKLELVAINRLRLAGVKLQEASGHQQPGFDFFHRYEASLPKGMTVKALKFCVHLAREFDKPVETLDEARHARQMMFAALDEESQPRRLAAQTAHAKNEWAEFVSGSASFCSLFERMIKERPMQDWDTERLSAFVRETQPIVDRHNEASRLLGE